MKRISLTQGKFAIVDDIDFEWLSQWKWNVLNARSGLTAVRTCYQPKKHTIYMHRQIMNCPPDKEIDHRNHNTLDNRSSNLRICTQSQNARNQISRRGMSQFKGVYWNKNRRKWKAQIQNGKKRMHLGYYEIEAEAAGAYNKKACELYGEFAYLNTFAQSNTKELVIKREGVHAHV